MTTAELAFINSVKKEYKEKFNKKLIIDFASMADTEETKFSTAKVSIERVRFDVVKAKAKLEELCSKYGTSIEHIRKIKKIGLGTHPQEYDVVREYALWVIDQKFMMKNAMTIINKDRSLLYWYSGNVKKLREKK